MSAYFDTTNPSFTDSIQKENDESARRSIETIRGISEKIKTIVEHDGKSSNISYMNFVQTKLENAEKSILEYQKGKNNQCLVEAITYLDEAMKNCSIYLNINF